MSIQKKSEAQFKPFKFATKAWTGYYTWFQLASYNLTIFDLHTPTFWISDQSAVLV